MSSAAAKARFIFLSFNWRQKVFSLKRWFGFFQSFIWTIVWGRPVEPRHLAQRHSAYSLNSRAQYNVNVMLMSATYCNWPAECRYSEWRCDKCRGVRPWALFFFSKKSFQDLFLQFHFIKKPESFPRKKKSKTETEKTKLRNDFSKFLFQLWYFFPAATV